MQKLDKKNLFERYTPKTEPVTVPGLDVPLTVRGLSAAQRGDLFAKCFDNDGKALPGVYFAAELIALSVVDQDGNRMFEDSDIQELGGMSGDFIDPLFKAAQRLSGLGKNTKGNAKKN
jgi:hypothetical protein